MSAVLLTGVAGFIGSHVARALLARGERVVGVDNLNAYYPVSLKRARLALLEGQAGFSFHQADVSDRAAMMQVVAGAGGVDRIVHLAAQAGVRHSMIDPYSYVTANVMGHLVMLELARHMPGLRHMVYASSSSVYGTNTEMPFSEQDRVDSPSSLYAATKRADELMSHAYAHLYGLKLSGLRFFTVYGPWGRPDMAYYGFARAIMAGRPLTVYDDGRLMRDFTYIDDIVAGVLGCLDHPPDSGGAARVYNIGNRRAEEVLELIRLLEGALGREAVLRFEPRPRADVPATFADVERLGALCGYAPTTHLSEGVPLFAEWFRKFHADVDWSHEGA